MKKKVWIECKKCKGKQFSLNQVCEFDEKKMTWEEYCNHAYLSHSGFGWELEHFKFICLKCKSSDIIVNWRGKKKEKKLRNAQSDVIGFILNAMIGTIKEVKGNENSLGNKSSNKKLRKGLYRRTPKHTR